MKNQYLILRICADDLNNNQFLLRGFDKRRMDKVIGIILVLTTPDDQDSKSQMYHLKQVTIDPVQSDTHQKCAMISWQDKDAEYIKDGFTMKFSELAHEIKNMRNPRRYLEVNLKVPSVFTGRDTVIAYAPSLAAPQPVKLTGTLNDYTVEEIIAHLRQRLNAEITIKL